MIHRSLLFCTAASITTPALFSSTTHRSPLSLAPAARCSWLIGRPGLSNRMTGDDADGLTVVKPKLTTVHLTALTAAQMIQPPPPTGKGSVASLQSSGQVRVRQHVNPLARKWSQPITLPSDWYSTAFADVSLPLVIDVGVAKGRFIYKMAKQQQQHEHDVKCNFLGLEIREPLVHQANRVAADAGLRNVFYVACNANVSFQDIVDGIPNGVLRDVYVQFCDPWFKKRHAKRRIVNHTLVDNVFAAMQHSAKCNPTLGPRLFFLQSDVLLIAKEMRAHVDLHGGFQRLGAEHGHQVDDQGWLLHNPIGLETEREIAVRNKQGNVYRCLFHCKPSPVQPQ